MRVALTLITLFLFTLPTAADEREVFYGTWGTEKQCARKPIQKGGTVLAEPFEISSQWLKQGGVWCNLNWGIIEKLEDGHFAGVSAQCGEDSIRSYFLGLRLKEENLTIRWDFPRANGPLAICPAS